jgi:hypothetical protein
MLLTAALLIACGDTTDGAGSGGAGGAGGSGGSGGAGGSGGSGQGGEGGAGGSGGGAGPAMPVAGESNVVKSCAPNDGPAYTFTIGLTAATCGAMPAGPVLRLTIYTKLDMPAGNTWDMAQNSPDGFALYYPGDDPSNLVFGQEGTLTVDTWDATKAATGSYDVVLVDGTHLVGDFNATACLAESPMCG